MSFTLHELTQNPELMRRAHEDVDKALNKHKQEISYDSISDMRFIDSCIKETLRKYPGSVVYSQSRVYEGLSDSGNGS